MSCELQRHKQDSDTMFEDTSQYSCDKLQQQEKNNLLPGKCNEHSEKKIAQGHGRILRNQAQRVPDKKRRLRLSIILHGPEQDWLVGISLLQQFSVYS